ncbi:MAG: hypothetical protein L6Q37_01725 [Bdellovibrionaceae bacterium]|nr:hypothetical protein [Pseudobdellovibrionaceae bacterium]NUM57167.1 hypothetical protein [Pseudobdellovibrionaceae bacterium]
MRILAILAVLLLVSCCPKEGIDKSSTINDYILAVDFYLENEPMDVQNLEKKDISIIISDLNNNNEASSTYKTSLEIQQQKVGYQLMNENDQKEFQSLAPENSNRMVFYFNERWNSNNIKTLKYFISNYKGFISDFDSYPKSKFQLEPISLTSSDKISPLIAPFTCMIEQLSNFILPKANAMSCKAKAGSKMTYREGNLISINIFSR